MAAKRVQVYHRHDYATGLSYLTFSNPRTKTIDPFNPTPFGLRFVEDPEFLAGDVLPWVVGDTDPSNVFEIIQTDHGQDTIPARTPTNDNILHFAPDCGASVGLTTTYPVKAGDVYELVLYASGTNGMGAAQVLLGVYPDDYAVADLPNPGEPVRPIIVRWEPEADFETFDILLAGEVWVSYVQVRKLIAFPDLPTTGLEAATQTQSVRLGEDIGLLVNTDTLGLFGSSGLAKADLPSIPTLTDMNIVASLNLLRTALISLGVATDGDA